MPRPARLSPLLAHLAAFRTVLEAALRPARRTIKLTGWIPICQVEDDSSPFPEKQRLYPERMRMLHENFDLAKYRPPICIGTGDQVAAAIAAGISPHRVAEGLPIAGHLADVEFDGVHLWARFAEIVDWPGSGEFPAGPGRVDEAVSNGHLGRSIGYWIDLPEMSNGYVLRHLLLLSGIPEGQMLMGMPPLSKYFAEALGPEAGARADSQDFYSSRVWIGEGEGKAEPAPAADVSVSDLLQAKMHEAFTVAADKLAQLGILSTEERIQVSSVIGDTLEYFRQTIKDPIASRQVPAEHLPALAFRSVSITPTSEGDTPMTEQEMNALVERMAGRTGELVTAAVEEAVKPLEEKIKEQAAQVEALKTETEAVRTASAEQEKTARESSYRSRLDACVRSLRLAPKEYDSELAGLMGRAPADADVRLKLIEERTPAFGTRTVIPVAGAEGKTEDVEIRPTEYGELSAHGLEAALAAGRTLPTDKAADGKAWAENFKRNAPPPPWSM